MFETPPTATMRREPSSARYGMPVHSAAFSHDVAAVLRERLPGLPTKKLHKLLYYCQGHHVAAFGQPLFRESIMAWDIGPVVGALWRAEKSGVPLPPGAGVDEAQLNTIGYVVSRYGHLTGRDLEHLTHQETPWQRADQHRRRGESTRIELAWLQEYFQSETEEDPVAVLDSVAISEWLAGAEDRMRGPSRADDPAEILGRLAAG